MRMEGAAGDAFRDLPGVTAVSDGGKDAELSLAPGTDPNTLLRALLERGTVRHFEVRTPSLHEIFKRVVGEASA